MQNSDSRRNEIQAIINELKEHLDGKAESNKLTRKQTTLFWLPIMLTVLAAVIGVWFGQTRIGAILTLVLYIAALLLAFINIRGSLVSRPSSGEKTIGHGNIWKMITNPIYNSLRLAEEDNRDGADIY